MSIDDAPLCMRNCPKEKKTIMRTPPPTRSPTTNPRNVINQTQIISIFGGPSISSGLRLVFSSIFMAKIREDEQEDSY